MSVKQNCMVINVIDGLNGEVIDTIKFYRYTKDTVLTIIEDLSITYLFENQRDIYFKVGYIS